MNRNQLEAIAQEVIERVGRKQKNEDTRLEIKSQWPDVDSPEKAQKTAKQLAGHANAAGGEHIVWLIGVDEKAGAICGASPFEPIDWLRKLRRHFDDEVVPDVTAHVSFSVDSKTVVAIAFATDRAPYCVRCWPDADRLEVPWRTLASTESASRRRLLSVLQRNVGKPEFLIELVTLHQYSPGKCSVRLRGLVVPSDTTHATLLLRTVEWFVGNDAKWVGTFGALYWEQATTSEDGGGKAWAIWKTPTEFTLCHDFDFVPAPDVEVEVRIPFNQGAYLFHHACKLVYIKRDNTWVWSALMKPHPSKYVYPSNPSS